MKKKLFLILIFLSFIFITSCDDKNIDNTEEEKDKIEEKKEENNEEKKEDKTEYKVEDNTEDKKDDKTEEKKDDNTENKQDDNLVDSFTSSDGIILSFKNDYKLDKDYKLVVNFQYDDLSSTLFYVSEDEQIQLIFDFDLVKDNNEDNILNSDKKINIKIPVSVIKEHYASFNEEKLNSYGFYYYNDNKYTKNDFKIENDYFIFNCESFDKYVLSFKKYNWSPIIWD